MNQNDFKRYIKEQRIEAEQLSDFVRLQEHFFKEALTKYHREINLASTFFKVFRRGNLASCILWINKLFNENEDRSLIKFLVEMNAHREYFREPALRSGLQIAQDMKMVTDKREALGGLRTIRNKYISHLDKDISSNKRKANNVELNFDSLNEFEKIAVMIVKRYHDDIFDIDSGFRDPHINDLCRLLARVTVR